MSDKVGPIAGQGDGARAESLQQPNARSEIDKRQPKPSHPAAEIYPLMQGKAFAVLVASVAANGLQEEIALYDGPDPEHVGKVLDGRNRERGCIAAGIEPRYKLVATDDPLGYVLRSNLRRHSSIKERRAACANALKSAYDRSNRWFAEHTGLSDHTVASIRKELEASGVIPTVTARVGADNKVRQLPKGEVPKAADGEAPSAEDANRAFCAVEPGEAKTSSGDQTPGDQTPGDQTPGDQPEVETSSGDETPGDETPGDEEPSLRSTQLVLALKEKLLPDEHSAYEEFAADVAKRVWATKLSLDERATILANRVRAQLGHKPAPVVAATDGEVDERLREAKHALESQRLAFQSQVDELHARLTSYTAEKAKLKGDLAAAQQQVAALKAALNKDHEAFIDAEFERILSEPQGKSKKVQQPQRKSKRVRQ